MNKNAMESQLSRTLFPDFFADAPIDPANEKRSAEVFRRLSNFSRDSFIFKHGLLPNSHPLQVYISNIAGRVPRKGDFPLNVKVAADWIDNNAIAFPDGTVIISIPLIKFAQTEEALIGVMAHEYVHVHREHAKKTHTGNEKEFDILDADLMSHLSVTRLQEYEADLRGVLVDLDKAGINPNGLKDFLERLHQKESLKQGTYSSTHGSSLDRALNIGSAYSMVDFRAIGDPLHSIPSDILDSAKLRPVVPTTLLKYSSNASEMEKAACDIDASDLQIALYTLNQRFAAKNDLLPIEDRKKTFTILVDRFLEECTPASLHPDERTILGLFAIEYGADVPVFHVQDKRFFSLRKRVVNSFKTPEQFRSACEMIRREYGNLRIKENIGDPIPTLRHIIGWAFQRETFGTQLFSDSIDLDGLAACVEEWSSLFADISANRDISKPVSKERLFIAGGEKVADSLPSKFEKVQRRVEKLFGLDQSEVRLVADFRRMGKELGSLEGVIGYQKKLDKYIHMMMPKLQQLQFRQATYLLKELMAVYEEVEDEAFIQIEAINSDQDGDISRDDKLKELRLDLIQYRLPVTYIYLMEVLIERHPETAALSKVQRAALLSSFHQRFSSLEILSDFLRDPMKEEKEEDSDIVQERAASYIIHSIQDILYSKKEWNYSQEADSFESMVKDEVKWILNVCDESRTREAFLRTAHSASSEECAYAAKIFCNDVFFRDRINMFSYFEGGDTRKSRYREHTFVDFLVANLAQHQSLEEVLSAMDSHKRAGVDAQSYASLNADRCGALVNILISFMQKGAQAPITSEQLLLASEWIANPFLRAVFQRRVLARVWDAWSFQERLDVLFPRDRKSSLIDGKTQEQFCEDAATCNEIHALTGRIQTKLDDILSEGSAMHGKTIVAELLKDPVSYNSLTFLVNLLRTRVDDTPLRKQMWREVSLERYQERYRIGSSKTDSAALVAKRVHAAESAMRSLYSLDPLGRHLVLRLLLSEHGGVLPDKKKRAEFLDFLFDDWICRSEQEQDVHAVLETVKTALQSVDSWELMYYALSSILQQHIVNPSGKAIKPWYQFDEVYMAFFEQGVKNQEIRQHIEGALWDIVPIAAHKYPWKYWNEYRTFTEDALAKMLKNLLNPTAAEQMAFTPIRFVKEVASRIGALGVRFLQLLPQFFPMSDSYASEFMDVYDAVKGQSKLAAIHLLEREWPAMWDTIQEIGERVGGGSIATVYRMKDSEGNARVIKVRNPNLEFHVKNTHAYIRDILDRIIQGGAHPSYAVAKPLLDDIKTWIEHDVNFEGFLPDDETFKSKHDGFCPPGFAYAVKIPQSFGPASKYFAIEEEVEGKNLTKWKELERDGHDMKQVISLIVKNFIAQIMDGVVHSDAHVGNFRVTGDRKVAILDRNFFLKLTGQERGLLTSMLLPFVPQAIKKQKLLEYLIPDRTALTPEGELAAEECVKKIVNNRFDELRESLIALRQAGVQMPLTFTLLLKNFNSLQSMAQQAGFQSLMEAYRHSPQQPVT